MCDTAIVGHRNFTIEHDLACLPGPCRGAIHQDSAAQQHGGKLRIPCGSFRWFIMASRSAAEAARPNQAASPASPPPGVAGEAARESAMIAELSVFVLAGRSRIISPAIPG